jgi:hypothetical protein
MKRFGWVLVLLTLVAGPAPATDAAPLYAIFQQFCIATGAKPEAVEAALRAAGWVKASQPDGSVSWQRSPTDHALRINTGTATTDNGRGHCMAVNEAADDASVVAIQKWVGVTPDVSGDAVMTSYFYVFREAGGVRSALPDNDRAAQADAETKGEAWVLVLDRARAGAIAYLGHGLPTGGKR